MRHEAVSQKTAVFRNREGDEHRIITKTFEIYDPLRREWHISTICFMYPDANIQLPVSANGEWMLPQGWELKRSYVDYIRQPITNFEDRLY